MAQAVYNRFRRAVNHLVPQPVIVGHVTDSFSLGLPVAAEAGAVGAARYPPAQVLNRCQGAFHWLVVGLFGRLSNVYGNPQAHFPVAGMARFLPRLTVQLDERPSSARVKTREGLIKIGYPMRPMIGKVSAEVIPTRTGGCGLWNGLGLTIKSRHS